MNNLANVLRAQNNRRYEELQPLTRSKESTFTKYDGTVGIPDWLLEDVPCFKVSYRTWLLGWNAAGVFAHLGFIVATVAVSTSGGKSMATPLLQLYETRIGWDLETNDLQPRLVATQDEDGNRTGLYLTWLTVLFFALSAGAHAIVVAGNWPDDGTWRTGWYFRWVHQCRQPARWIEYSLSASVMMFTIAFAAGFREVNLLTCAFVLTFCTMTYGWVTEELSRPVTTGDINKRPTTWETKNVFVRLAPHLIGYVPYLTVWVSLLQLFHSSVEQAPEGGRGPPWYVYLILYGQFSTFTLFGVTQFVNQLRSDGPEWYVWGEWSYLLLSLIAKGLLGCTLMGSIFAYDTFSEAVQGAS